MIDTQAVLDHRSQNPHDTLAAIGKRFKVSTSYIHSILKNNSVYTRAVSRREPNKCRQCKEYVSNRNKFCNTSCRFKYYRVEVKCDTCRIAFYIHRSRVAEKQQREQSNMYCCRDCYYRGKSENSIKIRSIR